MVNLTDNDITHIAKILTAHKNKIPLRYTSRTGSTGPVGTSIHIKGLLQHPERYDIMPKPKSKPETLQVEIYLDRDNEYRFFPDTASSIKCVAELQFMGSVRLNLEDDK